MTQSMYIFEQEAQTKGFFSISGVDEAGRGPLCGPVVAAAVMFPLHSFPNGINDSKKLSPKKREQLYDVIIESCQAYAIGSVEHDEIDKINIRNATFLAMKKALWGLSVTPDYVLVDGDAIPELSIRQRAIVKGDTLSVSIAAASILAKVTRDRQMIAYHDDYPVYNFIKHKGYPTAEHLRILKQVGPCPLHRKTFAPVRAVLSMNEG